MMDKYTPLTRERNANVPKMKANKPGPAKTNKIITKALSEPAQYQGNSVQFKNTIKSGSSGLP